MNFLVTGRHWRKFFRQKRGGPVSAALRRRCEERARELPSPVPFSARAMCDLVAAERGRPIRLMAMSGLSEVCGVWIAAETADFICYERATTAPHQEHIILHELSHLLCDHYPASLEPARFLPDLDPGMVRRVLGRASYSTVEEREAELLASLIRQRASLGEGHRAESGLAGRLHAAMVWRRRE